MATAKYTALAEITLSSSASSVTFGSIPQGYRDLMLVLSGGYTSSYFPQLRFNGDAGNNYTWVLAGTSGASTQVLSSSNPYDPNLDGLLLGWEISGTSSSVSFVIEIMDYKATDKHKTALTRANKDSTSLVMNAGRWANTAAITSVEFNTNGTGTFNTGSTFCLYGVK